MEFIDLVDQVLAFIVPPGSMEVAPKHLGDPVGDFLSSEMTIYNLAILTAVIAGIGAVIAVNVRLPNLAKAVSETFDIICEYIGAYIAAFVLLGLLVFPTLYAARWTYRHLLYVPPTTFSQYVFWFVVGVTLVGWLVQLLFPKPSQVRRCVMLAVGCVWLLGGGYLGILLGYDVVLSISTYLGL